MCGFIVDPKIAVASFVVCGTLGIPGILSEGIAYSGGIRIGKYIGFGSIKKAKQVILAQFGIEFTFLVIVTILYLSMKNLLPYLIANDDEIAKIVSNVLIYFVIGKMWVVVFMIIYAIYRALGYQKITAWIMVFANYAIVFPLELVLLFVLKWNENIYKGLLSLYGSYLFGYVMGCGVVIFVLMYHVNWYSAIKDSKSRIATVKNDYGSINNS